MLYKYSIVPTIYSSKRCNFVPFFFSSFLAACGGLFEGGLLPKRVD